MSIHICEMGQDGRSLRAAAKRDRNRAPEMLSTAPASLRLPRAPAAVVRENSSPGNAARPQRLASKF